MYLLSEIRIIVIIKPSPYEAWFIKIYNKLITSILEIIYHQRLTIYHCLSANLMTNKVHYLLILDSDHLELLSHFENPSINSIL